MGQTGKLMGGGGKGIGEGGRREPTVRRKTFSVCSSCMTVDWLINMRFSIDMSTSQIYVRLKSEFIAETDYRENHQTKTRKLREADLSPTSSLPI